MSEITFNPEANYSILNHYSYTDKSNYVKLLELVSYPIRTACGGHGVNLQLKDNKWITAENGPSRLIQIGVIALSLLAIYILPKITSGLGVLSALALVAKYAHADEAKTIKNLIPPQKKPIVDKEKPAVEPEVTLEAKDTKTLNAGEFKVDSLDKNEKFIYDRLRQGSGVSDRVTTYIYGQPDGLQDLPLFQNDAKAQIQEGYFLFEDSKSDEQQWHAFFKSDRKTGGLTQDALTMIQHPALSHLASGMGLMYSPDVVSLITGARIYGKFDPSPRFDLAMATEDQINRNLMVYDNPRESNLFAMHPPKGQEDINQFFIRVCSAFCAIKAKAGDKKVIIHTNNTGMQLEEVILVQRAAANVAGIDQIVFHYPKFTSSQHIKDACAKLKKMKGTSSGLTVSGFLDRN